MTVTLLFITFIVAVVVTIMDFAFPTIQTKKSGGTKYGTWGSTIGLIVGLFSGPFGILVGPFIGAFIGEMINDSRPQGVKICMGFLHWISFGNIDENRHGVSFHNHFHFKIEIVHQMKNSTHPTLSLHKQ